MQTDPPYKRVKGGDLSDPDLSGPLPRPRPAKGGAFRAAVWAVLALLVVGGASFWLTRAPAERENLRKEAAGAVNDALANTPLAGLGDIIARTPPPRPPAHVLDPPTDPGTLSGQEVTGTIAAPMDFGPLAPPARDRRIEPEKSPAAGLKDAARAMAEYLGAPPQRESVVFSRDFVGPVTEDSRVKPGYLSGLAQWLASRYKPGPDGGNLAVSAQSLNQECGTRLIREASGGRGGLLRYAFHPGMIDGLYNLYIDRFMADLDAAAARKGLSAEESAQFHAALGGRAAVLAAGIDAVLQVPDLGARLGQIESLAQKAVAENAALAEAVAEFDEAAPGQPKTAARLRVDGAVARYRRAADEHEQAQDALARAIRAHCGPGLDEETLLFMASWAGRREAASQEARGALKACVAALRDLSSRCLAAGRQP